MSHAQTGDCRGFSPATLTAMHRAAHGLHFHEVDTLAGVPDGTTHRVEEGRASRAHSDAVLRFLLIRAPKVVRVRR